MKGYQEHGGGGAVMLHCCKGQFMIIVGFFWEDVFPYPQMHKNIFKKNNSVQQFNTGHKQAVYNDNNVGHLYCV